MSAPRRRVDWSWGPGHGPLSGVANAAGAACATTMWADIANAADVFPAAPWATLALGAGSAALAAGIGGYQFAPTKVVCYRAACWLSAGIWSAVSIAGNPWSLPSIASLIVGSVTASAIGLMFKRSDDREAARQARLAEAEVRKAFAKQPPAAATEEDRIAVDWHALILKIARKDLEIVAVEKWEPYTGFTIDANLPADGTTIDDIKRHEQALATAVNLKEGCNVEVLPNDAVGRRAILIRVGTKNAMADDQHLAEDYSPATIENGISMGVHSDRSEPTINLRFACAVLIGQTDSGKSNQLNVITTGIVRCVDALEWAIDLSGNGRFPRPWVRAWQEGRAEEPAIDWVAATETEADLMTLAAIDIINGRTPAYQREMFAANVDYVPVTPDRPEVVIVVDEFGTLPLYIKDRLQTISDTGRGAGVRVVSCALAAKGQYISRDMIVQARERIGMRVTDEAELQFLFDTTWSRGRFDPASIPYKGSGMISTGAKPPQPFKGWRIDPGRVDAISIAVAGIRPALDDISADLAETVTQMVEGKYGKEPQQVTGVYSRRWERMLPVMFPGGGSRPTAPPPPKSAPRQPERVDPGQALATLQQANADMADALERAMAAAAAADSGASDQQPGDPDDPRIDELNALLDLPPVDPARPWSQPPRQRIHPRKRMRQMVEEAWKNGITPGEVHQRLQAEGYPTVLQTVTGWMRDDAASGRISQPGGDRTPYFPTPPIS